MNSTRFRPVTTLHDTAPYPEAIIGHTVSWRFSHIEVEHDDLKSRLAVAGFWETLPKPPSSRIAARRALEAVIRRRALDGAGPQLATSAGGVHEDENGQAQRALVRPINQRGSEHFVFVVVTEDVDLAAYGLAHWTDMRLLVDKCTGDLTVTLDATGCPGQVQESRELMAEIIPYWQKYRRLHTAGDISRLITEIVATMRPISMREGGGYYFVPSPETERLRALDELVRNLPYTGERKPILVALPQYDPEALADAAEQSFMDEIANLKADLQRFVGAEPGTVRPETIHARLDDYRALGTKLAFYAEMLGFKQHRMQAEVEELERRAMAVVLRKGAKPTSAPAASQVQLPFTVG